MKADYLFAEWLRPYLCTVELRYTLSAEKIRWKNFDRIFDREILEKNFNWKDWIFNSRKENTWNFFGLRFKTVYSNWSHTQTQIDADARIQTGAKTQTHTETQTLIKAKIEIQSRTDSEKQTQIDADTRTQTGTQVDTQTDTQTLRLKERLTRTERPTQIETQF